MKTRVTILSLALIATSMPLLAMADDLGTAGQFNGYIIGNASPQYTDVQGTYAVGGNATISATINESLVNEPYALVVGGSLSLTSDNVYGNIFTGSNANLSNPSVTGNIDSNGQVSLSNYGTVGGSIVYGTSYSNPNTTVSGTINQGTTTAPFSFSAVDAAVQSKSTSWASIAANGTSNLSYSTLTLTGTNNSFDVFNVSASQLAKESSFIINAPSAATVLINVAGTSDNFAGGFNVGGLQNGHILFNFYQATSLSIQGVGVYGSVLAPFANVNFSSGQLNGTLVAGSLVGGGELHNDLFNGNIQSVPEPSELGFLGVAILPFLARRRRPVGFKG